VRTTSPPPVRRRGASTDEVAAVSAALGLRTSLWPDDAAALLDPRGDRFQRLEWLGDSVLDHLTAHHRALGDLRSAGCCTGRTQQQLVSDRALAHSVTVAGLVTLLDWAPSAHRRADLVEASVAAAWLAGGWHAALEAAAALVHGPFVADADALLLGADPGLAAPACASRAFRRLAHLGSYVLEGAAAAFLYTADPGDEGDLTRRRHPLLAGRRLVRTASPGPSCGTPDVAHRVDHVQASVGLEQLRAGADRAADLAQRILGLGPRL
jgi:hypothetical protein